MEASLSTFLWPLLGGVAILFLFLLRGVVIAGKWGRRGFIRQVEALDGSKEKEIKKAMRAERATDFWEITARRLYYAIALASALGLIFLPFLPLTPLQNLYAKLLLFSLTFSATLLLLRYWQGWDEDRERFLRRKLRLAYEREQARRGQLVRDDLTGLYSQQFFLQELRREANRIFRRSLPISCLLLEMEGLQAFRARWGDQAADEVLRRIGQAMEQNVRSYDIVGRYSSSHFAIALLRCKETDVRSVGGRVANNVTQLPLAQINRSHASQLRLTWSSCTFPQRGKSLEELIAEMEMSLLLKKERMERLSPLSVHPFSLTHSKSQAR